MRRLVVPVCALVALFVGVVNASSHTTVTTTVTVQYRLEAGTATTADFVNGGATQTLTFPSGSISRFVAVNVKPDTLDETNETFTVRLMNPKLPAPFGDPFALKCW